MALPLHEGEQVAAQAVVDVQTDSVLQSQRPELLDRINHAVRERRCTRVDGYRIFCYVLLDGVLSQLERPIVERHCDQSHAEVGARLENGWVAGERRNDFRFLPIHFQADALHLLAPLAIRKCSQKYSLSPTARQ